ncbi:peptidase [Nocardioides houyundeii]|uniref:peptidase n=1 Tax=Nocardioides houyundeii TaxID=2045452 RepID=UPI000C79530A|nr:peptidase [Nocardioides houyundeii]
MHRLLTLMALVAGTLLPAAGAFGIPANAAPNDPSGIGIRLVDAPVELRDNPRALVYVIDHVSPGTTIERRIEVSNNTGAPTDIAVYPGAAVIKDGSFVGLEADTPNELTTWTSVSAPRLTLAEAQKEVVDVTIAVPSDAAPGEQYAVLWAQTAAGEAEGITQVSRVGIRVYLSVGEGGEPAADFDLESLTAQRTDAGLPTVTAVVRNTGGRALDLRGTLTLSDGPGGLSAGPFPVRLGTTLGLGQTAPIAVELDEQLPNGPWAAELSVTSGLLTKTEQASITFPVSGAGETVPLSDDGVPGWWWLGGGLVVLAAFGLGVRFVRTRRLHSHR